jgi:SH3 domain protein
LQTELNGLKSEHTNKDSDNLALSKPKEQISQNISEIQQIATNMPQLKQQRDQLQERVVNAERELQQLKREKQTLEDTTNQSWFIYGGMLAFAGVFLGLLIPKISWQKKSSSWDTY